MPEPLSPNASPVPRRGDDPCTKGDFGHPRPVPFLLILAALAAAALLATGATATGAQNRTLLVGSWHGQRGAYDSIQAAVDAANPGDWILVAPGDYHESPGRRDGVRITIPDIHLRGMTRSGVIVDGTRPGAPASCDPQARWQNLGPGRAGRNGIVVTASGVSVENLTVCNFVGGRQGRQIAFDGGFGTGKIGLGAFAGSYLTATSTFASRTEPALYGVFVSSTRGPGSITHSLASNMADSAFHVGACADCNTVFDHDTAEHSVIGITAINAGGHLAITHSTVRDNSAGIDLASEQDESSPPPQDGACPGRAGSCTIVAHNLVENNNDPNVPGGDVLHLIGAGILIAGGRHDTVAQNTVRQQGSYGIVTTPYPWLGRATTPGDRCQGGLASSVAGIPLCFFDSYGNRITGNHLSANGGFANPTNGDLADAGKDFFGTLGAELACATRILGPCDGTVAPVLPKLTALAAAVHAKHRTPWRASTPAHYPQQTADTAPKPPRQRPLPVPCSTAPASTWCPSH